MVTRKAVTGVALCGSGRLFEDHMRSDLYGNRSAGNCTTKTCVKTYPQSLANESWWTCDSNEVAGDDCQVEVSCVPHQLIPAPGWW